MVLDRQCGMPLLYDRIKQSMLATNHAATFFKKRAVIEEEYGRSMMKLAKSTGEAYATSEAKAGYVSRFSYGRGRIHRRTNWPFSIFASLKVLRFILAVTNEDARGTRR